MLVVRVSGHYWILLLYHFLFFYKQKPAYDVSISDWSSDVCSSDLRPPATSSGATPSRFMPVSTITSHAPPPAPRQRAICAGVLSTGRAIRSEERRVGKECVSPC